MLKFTTKRDRNGNRYTLLIDQEARTYKRSYNTSYDYSDYITITRKDRDKLTAELDEIGYKAI